jgi:hypothetical protein
MKREKLYILQNVVLVKSNGKNKIMFRYSFVISANSEKGEIFNRNFDGWDLHTYTGCHAYQFFVTLLKKNFFQFF